VYDRKTRPAVTLDGQEIHASRLSLTDIAMTLFDPAQFYALVKSAEPERAMDELSMTTQALLHLIDKADWTSQYEALLARFWSAHETTYRTLAKLSFLDALVRQRARQAISADGYQLALEALGLERFPERVDGLETAAIGERAVVSVLSLDGQIVPGLFQLTSKNTHHSFIHVLGPKPGVREYIGHDTALTQQKMLEAVHASPAHVAYLHAAPEDNDAPHRLDVITLEQDVFPRYLQQQHQLNLNPDHVFLRYLPGTSRTPLGSAHSPVTKVHTTTKKRSASATP
jgi:hypothetical protein